MEKIFAYLLVIMTILSLIIKRFFDRIPKFIHQKSPDTYSMKSIARYLAINAAFLLFVKYTTTDLPADVVVVVLSIFVWTILFDFPNSGVKSMWEMLKEMHELSDNSVRTKKCIVVE